MQKSSGDSKRSRSHSADSKVKKNRNYTGGNSYSGGKTADANGRRINQLNQNTAIKSVSVDVNTSKYSRNEELKYKPSKKAKQHKNLRLTLEEAHDRIIDSASRTAATEVLLTSKGGFIETEDETEKTYPFGPYSMAYSRNGRSTLLCGEKGHVAMMNLAKMSVGMELQLEEACYDAAFLHNEKLFACAQNKYTYIYDDKGVEIHCLRGHERPYKLDFLPYHFLLTTIGHSGWLKWQDVSTGQYVAGYQTGHGPARVLKHNPHNAVSHVGHSNGVVSLWSPAAGKALVSMFTHKAPVTDVAVDREGKFMTTAGLDGLVKIWDLRTYKTLHAFRADAPVVSLDISDTGLVAMGLGRQVQVIKDAFLKPSTDTYMKHTLSATGLAKASDGGGSAVKNVMFRPYEDILGISHSHGISNIVVPGSGEANFDSYEANPFQTNKQSREAEVHALLNKLSPEMIGLDSNFVGGVDQDQDAVRDEHRVIFNNANEESTGAKAGKKEKHKMRGRNKISAKLRRRQKNVVDAQAVKLKEAQEKARIEREAKLEIHRGGDGSVARGTSKRIRKEGDVTALSRFTAGPKDTHQRKSTLH
eukprot:GSChrysophyteH1.ASY1.ANO1.1920.1 assembled CDS